MQIYFYHLQINLLLKFLFSQYLRHLIFSNWKIFIVKLVLFSRVSNVSRNILGLAMQNILKSHETKTSWILLLYQHSNLDSESCLTHEYL